MTGSGVWSTVITTAANVTSVRDLTMPPGASYTYRIKALLSGGGTSAAVPTDVDQDFERVTFRDSQPLGAGAKRFLCVRIVK